MDTKDPIFGNATREFQTVYPLGGLSAAAVAKATKAANALGHHLDCLIAQFFRAYPDADPMLLAIVHSYDAQSGGYTIRLSYDGATGPKAVRE